MAIACRPSSNRPAAPAADRDKAAEVFVRAAASRGVAPASDLPPDGARKIPIMLRFDAGLLRRVDTAAKRRCHWHVENRLRWVMDGVFHDDLSRLRSGAGPQTMATVRHMAMNLLRGPKDKHSLKVRRRSAAWDTNDLKALLRQPA